MGCWVNPCPSTLAEMFACTYICVDGYIYKQAVCRFTDYASATRTPVRGPLPFSRSVTGHNCRNVRRHSFLRWILRLHPVGLRQRILRDFLSRKC